mmetsp:Transcript_4949/g.16533  ORF Transcript_4949/g.16533 Transcript_4949/m.16533 type:complete len:518 (-) Transcript_4949:1943-3496(-)
MELGSELEAARVLVGGRLGVLAHDEEVVARLGPQVGVVVQHGHRRHPVGPVVPRDLLHRVRVRAVQMHRNSFHQVAHDDEVPAGLHAEGNDVPGLHALAGEGARARAPPGPAGAVPVLPGEDRDVLIDTRDHAPAQRGKVVDAALRVRLGDEAQAAVEDRRLAGDELHHLAHGHARRKAVGVHDDVRHDAVVAEGHVLLAHDEAADALLPVARGELVAELGRPRGPHADLDDEVLILVGGDHDAVDVRVVVLRPLVRDRRRAELARGGVGPLELRRVGRDLLVDEHVPGGQALAHGADAVVVEHLVALVRPRLRGPLHGRRPHDAVRGLVWVLLEGRGVLAHHHAPPKSAVEGRAVEDERVLDVVARVGHDGYDGIVPGGELGEANHVDGARLDQGLVRVHEEVQDGVDALRLVAGHGAHGLLAHGGLVGVARGLVVVREGDDGGADAEDGGRVDLRVRVAHHAIALAEVLDEHGDHRRLLLLRVDELAEAVLHEVVPAHACVLLLPQEADVVLLDY